MNLVGSEAPGHPDTGGCRECWALVPRKVPFRIVFYGDFTASRGQRVVTHVCK